MYEESKNRVYIVDLSQSAMYALYIVWFGNTWQGVKKLEKNLEKSVDICWSLWYYCKALEREQQNKASQTNVKGP